MMGRGRPASLGTRVLEGVIEFQCVLDIELRLVDEEYRRRRERLGQLRQEALAMAQTLTAIYDQPTDKAA